MDRTVALLSFTYLPQWNGVSKHVFMLKRALTERGWKVRVYAPTEGADVQIKALSLHFSSALLYLPFSVKESIVHIHGFTNTLVLYGLLLGLLGKRVVWTWHGLPKGPLTWPFHLIAKLFRILKWPTISVSPVEGTLWIPNGVEKPPVKKTSLSRRRGWAFIGRMDKNKNPLKVAQVFYHLHARGDPGPFFFLGKDEGEMGKVVAFCKEKGMDCRFGFLRGKDYWKLLSSLKGLVSCSAYEGLPLTLLEAWSLGVPFFTSTPSLKPLLEKWHLPFLHISCSPEGARYIGEKWKEAAEALGKRKPPPWEEVAKQVEKVYSAVLKT